MGIVYAFMNSKGGVGKTTLAANIGNEIAEIAQTNVLLVDTDPQCNLTQIFYDAEQLDKIHPSLTIFATFRTDGASGPDPFPADLSVRVSPRDARFHIDLVRGSFETFRFGVVSGPAMARALLANFKDFIAKAKEQYKFVILDTNPCSTFTTVCSLSVADYVVAPVTLDTFSVRGIELIREVMSDMYPDLQWLKEDSARLKVIFNRIPRTTDPKKRSKILKQEELIRATFPSLSPSIMPDRVHHTSLLFNEGPGLGFALARAGRGFFNSARAALKDDLQRTATDLIATVNGRA
jgi:chromosome partitioning protein